MAVTAHDAPTRLHHQQESVAPSAYPLDAKRRKLRVAIITENFLPKVDGVTRTLARLLEHLNAEGHEAIVFGPETGMTSYAGHPVVGTFGLPLVIYPGLKLNFLRPRFIRRLQQFKPDVIHFVDPIWLGAQMLPVVQKWLPLVPCVSSYHTNLPTYATLFGMPWLEATMWKLTRSLHDRCEMVFCPSESTRRMLQGKGFSNVKIWSRGVDTEIFNPQARDDNLRASWGCTPKPDNLVAPLTPSISNTGDEAALVQLAAKLGVSVRLPITRRSLSASPDDESFIRTPPTGPSLAGSPELSPPPSYDSLAGIPELESANFALPPPAMPTPSAKPAATAPPQQNLHPAESRTVILYVGRISWEKNLRLLIEAFKLLPTAVRSNAKLVFVGDGPARGELTRVCSRLGLDASFMGHQKGKRLAAMYASASVFAFPSFTETFGQVVLEALASGLPVVGLHAEGTSDLVTHGRTGLLLDVAAAAKSASSSASSALGNGKEAASGAISAPASPRLTALRASASTASRSDVSASTAIADFAQAASTAAAKLRPAYERSGSSSSLTGVLSRSSSSANAVPLAPTSGLATPIPSVGDFAAAMSTSSAAFAACARSYSMLLERLIRDRALRAAMGQRAQVGASRKTWWDAMDAVVQGYEEVVEKAGIYRLSDEELEELRARQQRNAPLTGPIVKMCIVLYLALFLFIWTAFLG
ncbi:UDP-Glycosyltransferase/glycogen phosphorylase [Ceraceosorus guamensis]|uniref:UDP-Glycosyltransferase/glycogen phosphorylase n=1 Tax=Ceraceosorus guamensis TaxID=1522189 RepID=A0A316W5P6_9BASI|nr:UDP-Glycosyltransferase/glycogen phosphorylase [Ceraceosorus guamensis]PWN44984.1 UDP-Glycosyltransferase/glycogen phosphorylase [Ceraceosorus guamensis]